MFKEGKEFRESTATSKPHGAALSISLAIILIVSAFVVSTAALSGTNARLASSRIEAASAKASAESGLEISQYWLNRVVLPSSTPTSDYFETIVNTLRNDLAENSKSNITLSQTGFISCTRRDLAAPGRFSGRLLMNPASPSTLQVYSTGGDGRTTRTVGVRFNIKPYEHPIFKFGIATRGPLVCAGNLDLQGTHSPAEASVYVESPDNTSAEGECVDFPVPDTRHFRQYATGQTITSSSSLSGDLILTNAVIAAGTNPRFTGHLTIEGILFIESPNTVTFDCDVALLGLIVADGAMYDGQSNKIDFLGRFSSGPYPNQAQFKTIAAETGSSILAPGFAVAFRGGISSLEGVVAAYGVTLCGNVTALVKGTIINYSTSPLNIDSDAAITFDRQACARIPAGFDSLRVLTCNPSSYEELPM